MHHKETTYERIANKLLKHKPKPIPIGTLINGRLYRGWKSRHKTLQSRNWRLFWRLKSNRVFRAFVEEYRNK